MKQMMKSKQRGVTLIELSFVLAIFGLLIAGALAGVTYFDNAKAVNEASALQRVIASLQQKFVKAPTTSGATTASAITGNIFKESTWSVDKPAGLVYNQFGGSVSIASNTLLHANDSFKLVNDAIPNEVCQKLVPMISDMAYRVDIGTVTVKANPSVAVAPATIDTECDKGVGATQSKVTLYFLRRP